MADSPTPKPRGRVARFIERARRPNRAHVDKLKDRVPFWFVALVLFAFALLQILLNPFGFSDLTQRYTQDVSNLLITGPYLYPSTGRDQVTVALVDEDTLQKLQMPWPWSYGQHARALSTIRSYRPKAVIVDFLFVDARNDDSLPDLVEEIRRFKADGIPLYFEGGTDLPFGEAPLLPALANTGVKTIDPTIETYDGVVRQYKTTGHCFSAKGEGPEDCLSAAFQVYHDLYPEHPLPPRNGGEMEIVWGTDTAPINVKLNKGSAVPCSEDAGFALRLWRAFFDKKTALSRCPYNAEVPMQALLRGDEDADIAKLIPGHVVFYGGALKGAQDTSYFPANGKQANVFVHAMALDNLITFEGQPEQNVMTVAGVTIGNEPAQILAIIPIILVLSWLHLRRIRTRRRRRAAGDDEHGALYEWFAERLGEHFWYWFGYLLALAVGLVLALSVGLSVANWVEDVFVSAELGVMLLVGIPDSFWGYLHHVAGGVPGDQLQEAST